MGVKVAVQIAEEVLVAEDEADDFDEDELLEDEDEIEVDFVLEILLVFVVKVVATLKDLLLELLGGFVEDEEILVLDCTVVIELLAVPGMH